MPNTQRIHEPDLEIDGRFAPVDHRNRPSNTSDSQRFDSLDAQSFDSLAVAIDTRTAPYAALTLRLALGVVFVAHGLAKLLVFTLPGTVEFFTAHGFPGWSAYPVFAAELLGGIALIAGVQTRNVAIGLVPVMLGAITVHWPNGWSFNATGGGWEYVAFLIAALITQAALGDGAFAVRPGRRAPRAKR